MLSYPSRQVTILLSNLPAYRTGVSPLLRGVEVGLAHGFFLTGPFIKLGPLRATEVAEVAGSLSGAGLVLILAACLSIYGAVSFQQPDIVGVKTLTGRSVARDPLQTSQGWAQFSSGWLVGDSLTVADLALYSRVMSFKLGKYDDIPGNVVDAFPKVSALYDRVLKHPKVVEWNSMPGH
jgi:photosystem I subunit 11